MPYIPPPVLAGSLFRALPLARLGVGSRASVCRHKNGACRQSPPRTLTIAASAAGTGDMLFAPLSFAVGMMACRTEFDSCRVEELRCRCHIWMAATGCYAAPWERQTAACTQTKTLKRHHPPWIQVGILSVLSQHFLGGRAEFIT